MQYSKNTNPLKKGNIRYVIIYEGYGVRFKTDVDAVDKQAAKKYFKSCYSSVATIISIRKKREQ
mgnify:CR=1 FL=1